MDNTIRHFENTVKVAPAKPPRTKAIKPANPAQDLEVSPDSLIPLLDKNDATNRLLAKHPRASSELLEMLSHSSDKATRKSVCLNPNSPKDILLRLAPQFPSSFFKNPAFDWLILEDPGLLINLGQGVLKNILKIPDCPESFMRWAVEFGSEDEKLAVALNINAPIECLQELAKCHGDVSSAALGHMKLHSSPILSNLEDVFITELKDQIYSLSCANAAHLFKKNLIDLPQFSYLNSTVRLVLANQQFSVEAFLREVGSPDPCELMNLLWWCYFNYDFESFPRKLEEVASIKSNLFHENHLQLLIQSVEKRLMPFFKSSDETFFWQETYTLIFLFSCTPPDAAFPERIYRLLRSCCLKSEVARENLLDVCQTAAEHKHCPTWFKEIYFDTHKSVTANTKGDLVFDVDVAINTLHLIKINWLDNNHVDYELNCGYFDKAISNKTFWNYSKFFHEDVDRIFMATFDLYVLLDQQVNGWSDQETSEFGQWIVEIIKNLFQSAACPQKLLVEVTQQKDKRFTQLIRLAKSVLDLPLVIHEPKTSHWFLNRQRRTRDLTVAPSVEADNVLYIRDAKAQTACNNRDLVARVLGLSHRLARPEVLAKRCKSLHWIERMAIARNPNTPLNILEVLKKDAHVWVSHQAELSSKRLRNVPSCEKSTNLPSGEFNSLNSPCPNCGGRIVFYEPDEIKKAGFNCKGTTPTEQGCGFKLQKIIAKRAFLPDEVNSLIRDKRIGPIDGFRSMAGWPFTAVLVLKFDEEANNYKLEFDFDDDKSSEESGELIDFSSQISLGACPKCGAEVYEHGSNYVCEKSVSTLVQPTSICDFKCGQLILKQPISHDQMCKLLETGKTDVLDKFVSMRSRKTFKARLIWDAEAGKVNFEFLPQTFQPAPTVPRRKKLRPPMQFLRKPAMT